MLVKAKETIWLEGLPPHNWRKIAITLIDRDRECNRLITTTTGKQYRQDFPATGSCCSLGYSALASFRMGMSGSASFQRAKKCGFRFGGIAGHGVASGKDRGGTNICLLNAAETEAR
jgi:hypothetical protein